MVKGVLILAAPLSACVPTIVLYFKKFAEEPIVLWNPIFSEIETASLGETPVL